MSRAKAASLLSKKSHLTKLQIEQFLGRREQIGEETVLIALKVSDGHERHFRAELPKPKKRVRMVRRGNPMALPSRLNIEEATRELADFTQSEVQ